MKWAAGLAIGVVLALVTFFVVPHLIPRSLGLLAYPILIILTIIAGVLGFILGVWLDGQKI